MRPPRVIWGCGTPSSNIVMATISSSMAYKVVISITHINENSKDVWFEGKILNKYGIFDFVYLRNLKRA